MSKPDGYLSQIHLGSNGRLYGEHLSDGILLCRPWGTQEEMLINSQINHHILLDKLIAQTCQLPTGLTAEDLSVYDRFQIFFHQRCISYPRPYDFSYRCSECGEKASSRIDLAQLEIRRLGTRTVLDRDLIPVSGEDGQVQTESVDFSYPIQVDLPVSGKRVTWRYLTGADEKRIERYEQRSKAKAVNSQGDVAYVYRLALRFAEIDGEPAELGAAMDLVTSLVGEDLMVLRESFDFNVHGLITEVEPVCNHCGFANGPFALPFDASFFRPTRAARGY